MPIMIITVSLVFGAVFCLTLLIIDLIIGDKLVLSNRLQSMEIKMTRSKKIDFNEELQADFATRILKPVSDRISSLIQKYTPIKQISFIEQKLDYAGRPHGWNANNYLMAQYATTIGVAILALVLSWVYGTSRTNQVLALLLGLVGGYALFELWLTMTINNRRKAIEKDLPEVLDLLTISIEAGLGFDAAMQRVVQKTTGPISEEFNQTLQEMRIGRTRREVLQDLSTRTGVLDLSRFVDALIQADQLGISLGNVLRNQSDQMRTLRRQRIQEQAMKAPIKMLFPMLIFIVPVIMIVILAPSFAGLMETL